MVNIIPSKKYIGFNCDVKLIRVNHAENVAISYLNNVLHHCNQTQFSATATIYQQKNICGQTTRIAIIIKTFKERS